MRLRLAAAAACVVAFAVAWPVHAADPLTLDDAFARVAETHPDLRMFAARRDVLAAELDRASLTPALVAGAEVENAFGTGEASGVDGAELTLSLASVLERGGKLDARRTLAQSRIDALAVEREAQRLDLLAETARRYLAVVAAQRHAGVARLDIEQRERTVAAARARHQAGASPESVVLTAQAALARAELDLARAQQRETAARQHLAALWGERAPAFEIAGTNPLALPALVEFTVLADWLKRTPELARFAGQARIREARLQLARSEASADLDWQVGVRALSGGEDFGLVGSVSLPLGAASRAQPGIRAARAELAALEIEREAAGLALYSTLAEAHGRYRVAQLEVARLQSDVLPRLDRAEAAAERAYRAGAASYLEWATLQADTTEARRQQLQAALDAQRALIEIQRLTGQVFIDRPAVAGGQPQTEEGVAP
ncbi:TolC family protein [Coralloluteibacterium stylophorae]|uniref:TolC family protein n=1 Tax=Coralloluteibacterium stylophorae TaxID=1776034 RepID=A0A8J7VVU3_9GAMM|nr:TolC family protein [Coralloluteibacterium stylophorae]MBS7457924.1 TolC family protein [Coralloluteibacterium stylophorae]